ncbi:MAG: hypothetical protein JRG80_17325 [Deltaproteobacteria bacterium]|nr:hypothetical protein [Deltaproteobacteria bacterium]
MRQSSSRAFKIALMASMSVCIASGAIAQDMPRPSAVDQPGGQVNHQLGMVESAGDALSAALQSLAEAQNEKPNRSDTRYWDKDKDGNKVFKQEAFDADMGKWQDEINRLTSDVETRRVKLAQEESGLDGLQSKSNGAASNDERRRRDALEREK